MRRSVAAELVGHETPGLASLCGQQAVEESLSGQPIASTLDEDVDRVAVLVDGPPEVSPPTPDGDEELVQVPGVAQAALSPGEVTGVDRTELPTPLTDGLLGDDDPALGEEIFNVSEAEAEAVVQPDRVADDLGWESVASVARHSGFHRLSLPGSASSCQYWSDLHDTEVDRYNFDRSDPALDWLLGFSPFVN
jgi:hypothetical protein